MDYDCYYQWRHVFEMRVKHLLSWFQLLVHASLLFQLALTGSISIQFSCWCFLEFVSSELTAIILEKTSTYSYELYSQNIECTLLWHILGQHLAQVACFWGYYNAQLYFNSFYELCMIGLMDGSIVMISFIIQCLFVYDSNSTSSSFTIYLSKALPMSKFQIEL